MFSTKIPVKQVGNHRLSLMAMAYGVLILTEDRKSLRITDIGAGHIMKVMWNPCWIVVRLRKKSHICIMRQAIGSLIPTPLVALNIAVMTSRVICLIPAAALRENTGSQ